MASRAQSVNVVTKHVHRLTAFAHALVHMKGHMQSDQHQRAELFARESGLLTRRRTSEVARSARTPLRCHQRLVIRGQRWQMHACCREGVASNRCVKLPTVDPLSHVRIDWLLRTELRHRKPTTRLRPGLPEHTGLWMVVPPIPGETAWKTCGARACTWDRQSAQDAQ